MGESNIKVINAVAKGRAEPQGVRRGRTATGQTLCRREILIAPLRLHLRVVREGRGKQDRAARDPQTPTVRAIGRTETVP